MNPNYLDFEQPIADLEAKIEELRMVGNDTDINITDEITRLKKKSVSLTESIFSDLKPWDVAAGILMVKEAGGTVSRCDGGAYTLDERTIIASNGRIQEYIVEKIK